MAAVELVRRNAAGAAAHAARAAAGSPVRPALGTVLLTCMDARIDPVAAFGIAPGEVHVLRNAGGVVTDDVVRSIAISQRKLGTGEVLIVAHTGCGMTTFTDDEFSDELATDTGMHPPWRVMTFRDPADRVRRGVARLRRDPFLRPGTMIRGYVLDIDSFTLDEVSPR